jgi:hypothetical protein
MDGYTGRRRSVEDPKVSETRPITAARVRVGTDDSKNLKSGDLLDRIVTPSIWPVRSLGRLVYQRTQGS